MFDIEGFSYIYIRFKFNVNGIMSGNILVSFLLLFATAGISSSRYLSCIHIFIFMYAISMPPYCDYMHLRKLTYISANTSI